MSVASVRREPQSVGTRQSELLEGRDAGRPDQRGWRNSKLSRSRDAKDHEEGRKAISRIVNRLRGNDKIARAEQAGLAFSAMTGAEMAQVLCLETGADAALMASAPKYYDDARCYPEEGRFPEVACCRVRGVLQSACCRAQELLRQRHLPDLRRAEVPRGSRESR